MFNKMSSDDLSAAPAPAPAPSAFDSATNKGECDGVMGVWNDVTGKCTPANNLDGGRRHRGVKTKTLRRMLKKAGLKVSGKKATLTKRCKKAHLMRGGLSPAGYPFGEGMAGGGLSVATNAALVGGRRHGVKAKTLKKLLKRAGLKVSGKKATLRARAKKAHLVRG